MWVRIRPDVIPRPVSLGGDVTRTFSTLARAPVGSRTMTLSVPTPALTSPPLSLCPLAPSARAARAARSRPLLAPPARAARSRRTLVPPARAACSRRPLAPHSLPARASLARRSHLALFASRPRRVPRSRDALLLQGRWFRCRVCRRGRGRRREIVRSPVARSPVARSPVARSRCTGIQTLALARARGGSRPLPPLLARRLRAHRLARRLTRSLPRGSYSRVCV